MERLDANTEIDKRLREISRDGLLFGIKHPLELDFGTETQKSLSPNSIGFQFVLACVATRLRAAKRKALKITVDRQTQFNPTQIQTYVHYSQISATLRKSPIDRDWYVGHPVHEGARRDIQNLISHFPEEKITISTSPASIGLQLVDVYLWIVNRSIASGLPPELNRFAAMLVDPMTIDGISVPLMIGRFKAFEKKLPQLQEISPEIKERHEAAVEAHRKRVKDMNLG